MFPQRQHGVDQHSWSDWGKSTCLFATGFKNIGGEQHANKAYIDQVWNAVLDAHRYKECDQGNGWVMGGYTRWDGSEVSALCPAEI